uniref:Uncharacterized protein n=1 Tax=Romanomermis culicivorax TaxID=13658 RepID=A0A915KD48_ROMCU
LLRVYFHNEPGWYDFAYDPYHYTFQRVFRITIGTILKKIDTALGYRDDPEIVVNITNKFPYQPAMEVVKLSAHSFCAAIIEMIPFRPDEIKSHLTSC